MKLFLCHQKAELANRIIEAQSHQKIEANRHQKAELANIIIETQSHQKIEANRKLRIAIRSTLTLTEK